MSCRTRSVIVAGSFALLAAACALKPVVPGGGASIDGRVARSGFHTVAAGDTLYSIAWDAGYDYRSLAEWNGIRPPYLIRPGQTLRLSPPGAGAGRASGAITVASGDSLSSIAAEAGVDHRDLAAWNNIPPPYIIRPGQTLRILPPDNSAARKSRQGRARDSSSGQAGPESDGARPRISGKIGSWAWPTRGKIIARYSRNGANKGIDISGVKGQDIISAAPGRVVYQGSGLRGYGRLIIIKHNEDYLSAYAHSDRVYVKEGDMIRRGQKIAGMGSSGTDRVKLHFEIRYRGRPVDPERYLPKI